MSYRQDPVYRTVRWLRAGSTGPGGFATLWAERAGLRPDGLRLRLGLTNYKPFERARVVAEIVEAGPDDRRRAAPALRRLFLHVAATPEAARRERDRSAAPALLLEDRALVAWTLPERSAPGTSTAPSAPPCRGWCATIPGCTSSS